MTNSSATLFEAGREREFAFGDEDFHALRVLVKQHTGIHLGDQKRELVYSRISRRLRALNLTTFRDYRHLLTSQRGAELTEFCNAITTNLTAFFREPHHFDYLRQRLRSIAADPRASRRFRIWSAGCSTGEEPYTIAMALFEALGDLAQWDIRILATDIDSDVLKKARRGAYPYGRLNGLDSQRRARFFHQDAAKIADGLVVNDELRDRITFKQLNLMNTLPMKGPLDAIFCRNVVIYFDKDTQRDLFARYAELQRPGDLLFVGHSENLANVCGAYELIGKTVHRRI
jgi:chemotaxis protein methyltransferase CheR